MTEWITPCELSEMTGIKVNRLKQLRYERKVFPFHKIPGTKESVYNKTEIDQIIEQGRVEVVNV